MADETPPDERRTVPFATVLQGINGGLVAADLAKKLQQLTEAVDTTGKAGSLTLTLKLSKTNADGMLELMPGVSVKLPQPKVPAAIFYVDADSNLVRSDPRQTELDLGPVRVANNPERAAR